MKSTTKLILAAALATATTALADGKGKKAKAPAKDTMGQCFGVVGKEQGDCGGKDPATGASWGCAGQNPTSDLGWKRMSKAECDKAPKHAEATAKKFVPDPA